MSIKWESVVSSNIKAIGYDYATSNMYVQFHNNSEYVYYGVPYDVMYAFVNAPSKGRAHWQLIRGEYTYEKII